MSHNLNYNEQAGRHAFASAKEIAWHKLGIVVDNAMTSKECIEQALLNYTVEKGNVFVKYNNPIGDGAGTLVPEKFATYRTDTGDPFNIVGKNYEVIQNWEAFEFFDNIVGRGRAIYETAGALGNGETVFITAKLPAHLRIGNEDIIDQYLLLTMSHDGTGSIIAKYTPIRVVCNNTLSIALSGGKNLFKIRHTYSARDRMAECEELLKLTYLQSKETQEILEQLTKIQVTDALAERYFLNLMLSADELTKLAKVGVRWHNAAFISTKKKNVLTNIFDYRESGIGQNMNICRGTAYGLYNTITGYLQNIKSYSDDERKFKNILMGTDETLLQNALKTALVLT